MKKVLFIFAALLQTVLVMAQNPARQPQQAQQKATLNCPQPCLKNAAQQATKNNRPWIIVGDHEDQLQQNKIPSPPGPNAPMPIFLQLFK